MHACPPAFTWPAAGVQIFTGGKEAHSREAVEIPKMILEAEKKNNCPKRHSVSV